GRHHLQPTVSGPRPRPSHLPPVGAQGSPAHPTASPPGHADLTLPAWHSCPPVPTSRHCPRTSRWFSSQAGQTLPGHRQKPQKEEKACCASPIIRLNSLFPSNSLKIFPA